MRTQNVSEYMLVLALCLAEFVIEIVTEISMEHTRLFQCILLHYVDRLTTFITEILIDLSAQAVTEIDKNQS